MHAAKARFFTYWLTQTEEQRKALIKDDKAYAETVKEVQALGCPSNQGEVEKVAESFFERVKANKRMEDANEYIKLRMKQVPKASENAAKFEEYAVLALTGDKDRLNKVQVAENLYRRVVKSGSSGASFKAKAKELYKLSALFQ